MKAYKECIVKIIESGYSHEFEDGEHKDEIVKLWEEINQMCLNILSSSINLIYSNNSDIAKSLKLEDN